MDSVKIGIIEDQLDYRKALQQALEQSDDMECVYSFGSMPVAMLETKNPKEVDLWILDLDLPVTHGLQGLPQLRERFPNSKVVVLTLSENKNHVQQALADGAIGYLVKSDPLETIIDCLRSAQKGQVAVSPDLSHVLLDNFKKYASINSNSILSRREKQILKMLKDGHKLQDVADQLNLSKNTVNAFISRVFKKLDVKNINSAINKAINECEI